MRAWVLRPQSTFRHTLLPTRPNLFQQGHTPNLSQTVHELGDQPFKMMSLFLLTSYSWACELPWSVVGITSSMSLENTEFPFSTHTHCTVLFG